MKTGWLSRLISYPEAGLKPYVINEGWSAIQRAEAEHEGQRDRGVGRGGGGRAVDCGEREEDTNGIEISSIRRLVSI